MFKNYLKISFRNIGKYRFYSIINVSGLAVGMACVLLMGLFIQDELSYDKYHKKSDRIYRLTKSYDKTDYPSWIGTPAPLAPILKTQFPEIESYVRFDPFLFKVKTLVSYNDKSFYEERFFLADKSLFKIFDFELLQGDLEMVLADPNSLVITKTTAVKYFGDENPIGKILNYDNELDFVVSGVIEDVPDNSHFGFDFVASFESINQMYSWNTDLLQNWRTNNFYTYVLLKENVNLNDFTLKGSNYLREIADQPDAKIYLQPLTDIHLSSKITSDPLHKGAMSNIYMYASIAIVVLLIACINFMNLYTANSEIRAKEVGMRKVLGAHKKQLVMQFLAESFVLAFIALPIAVFLVELILPQFNQVANKALEIEYSWNQLFGGLLALTVFVGVVAGSYPAYFISAIAPTKILRGKINPENKGFTVRNLLVIFQFAISVIFIVSSLIINSQMRFVRNKQLGYDRENIVNVSIHSDETKTNYETFRNEIVSKAEIVDVTATSFTPSVDRWRKGSYFEGRKENDDHMFYRIAGDFNLLDVYGMEIISGRNFDRNISTDLRYAYILNESAVKSIGWKTDEVIGKAFGDSSARVVGVVKDFHFRSLHYETMPLAINILPGFFQYISIKIRPGDIHNTIRFLEEKWAAINPQYPFEYYFLNDDFDKLYKSDQKLEAIFKAFTILAIFIACLGLLGLSYFAVRRRTKEIGIRKVLGASVVNITKLLSKDFVKLMIISNIIAWPVAWLTMNSWLQNFAYRVDLSWWMFVLAGGLGLTIALLTISAQAIKAALLNPVEALRNE